MAVAHCSLLADRCYTVMTATSQGGSHIATVGSTAWCRLAREGRARQLEGGVGWGLIGPCTLPSACQHACRVLFLDYHRQETLPSYSLMGV